MRPGHVARPDCRGEAEVGGVGAANELVGIFEAEHREDGAEDLLAGDRHRVADIRKHRRLDEEALRAVPLPAGGTRRPLALPGFDVAENLVELRLVDLRPLLGVGMKRITDAPLPRQLHDALHEGIVDRVLDEQPRPGAAALPLVEMDAEVRPRHRRIEIGIGKDDVGAFPPELERQPLEARCRLPHDDPRRLAGAGEGDLVDARMVDKRRPGRRPVAGNDIDHAVGDSRFLRQPGQAQAGQRRLLGRLDHDRAAGGQRRPPLPGHHQDREVPRDHLPHHPHRLAARVAVVVAVDRDRRALDLVGPAGVVAEALHGQRDVDGPRVGDRLAVVEGLERREVIDLGLDQVA